VRVANRPRDEAALGSAAPARSAEWRLERGDVYRGRLAGDALAPTGAWQRLATWLRLRLKTSGEREEAALNQRLSQGAAALTRTNHVAVVSPKGGVGKTTCTFLAGDVLCRYLRLRCIAVDANPDYGTLGSLAPDRVRSDLSLAELLDRLDDVRSPGELRPFVSPLPSGLHLLAAPGRAEVMATMTPERYERLVAFLDRFYEVVLLDLGTGLTDPIARFALQLADQTLVVSTPEWVTAERVLGALSDLDATLASSRVAAVLNQAPAEQSVDRQVIEAAFRRSQLGRRITVPYDPRLRELLDAGAYDLDRLMRPTRLAVKRLGLAVVEGLA
jgi:MinD-like ATPase involved in chromosome partitioning or flagellar assembly